ncbi:MAG: periplasmic heavy metal sensor [Candidatus Aminicenantes bacterium]|nr:periplasmic heavy metal sensor [Candidatus Aminicenantes bacterium]
MNKRMMTLMVIALMAFGFSALAQDRPASPERPGRAQMAPGQAPMRGMMDLGLTPEQEAKLEAHRKAAAEQQKAFAEQMRKIREEMQSLRKDGAAPDPAKNEALIDRMFKLRADQAKATARNRAERNKIFTPEQLEKMKNLRNRAMAPGMGMMRDRMGMTGGRRMMTRPGGMAGRMGIAARPMLRMMDRNRSLLRDRVNRARDMRRRALRWIREE